MNIKELEDRAALKELVDRIALLGDKKDFQNQVQLFSENAVSETIAGGATILKLEGRNAMAAAFAEFLARYDTVYHFNGQLVLTIDGDRATGMSYCLVTLIGRAGGDGDGYSAGDGDGDGGSGGRMKTTIGARYHDDFVREDNQWKIVRRVGYFEWQETRRL